LERIDADSEGVITIDLPIEVQTSTSTWYKSSKIWEGGLQAVIARFTGLSKDYHKKPVDSTVVFDI